MFFINVTILNAQILTTCLLAHLRTTLEICTVKDAAGLQTLASRNFETRYISFSCVPARIPRQRQKYNVTVWATVFDSALFDKTHLFHQPQALVVLASNRHDNLVHLAHVERVIKYCRQVRWRKPSLYRDVTPNALVVPILVNYASNKLLVTLKADCGRSTLKIPATHSLCDPMAHACPSGYIPAHPVWYTMSVEAHSICRP